jgi:hypothetical protein
MGLSLGWAHLPAAGNSPFFALALFRIL